jgi:hypothetical protein
MATLAIATFLVARGEAGGWWVAALGAATKLFPGVTWLWGRRQPAVALVALVVAVGLVLAPALLTRHSNDSYIGFNLHRGVEAEAVAASTAWVVQQVEGRATKLVYRFRSNELPGSTGASHIWVVIAALGMAAVALKSGRRDATDPWLAAFVGISLLLCGSKVLSPQYMAWPAPLAAVLGGPWFRAWLVIAGLTLAAYAFGTTNTSILAIVLIRNVALVGTTAAGLLALLRRPAAKPAPGAVHLFD